MQPGIARLVAALAAGLLAACAPSGEPQADAPVPTGFLIISIDTLRADRVGAYGHDRETTPALDRLAREGVVFENAVANSPWTLPSHGSMLTGLYPREHGLKTFNAGLREGIPTLAEVLRGAGYHTRSIYNSLYLGERFGLTRGFDEHRYFAERDDGRRVRSAAAQVDLAIEWMDEMAGGPFFLLLHNYDVHSGYTPTPEYVSIFADPDYRGTITGSQRQLKNIREGRLVLDEADLRHLNDLYDAGIRQLDDELGRLLDWLDDAGLAETTYVLAVSDHGEEFLEHGGVLHGRTMYEELLAVPMILRGPGIPAGARVARLAQLHDVFPTVLTLAGAGPAGAVDGLDLSSSWAGGAAWPERMAFGEADHHNVEDDIKRMARRGAMKLIHDRLEGVVELYDLDADPGETTDLADRRPDDVLALMEALERYRSGEREAEELAPLDREDIELLRELGYVP